MNKSVTIFLIVVNNDFSATGDLDYSFIGNILDGD